MTSYFSAWLRFFERGLLPNNQLRYASFLHLQKRKNNEKIGSFVQRSEEKSEKSWVVSKERAELSLSSSSAPSSFLCPPEPYRQRIALGSAGVVCALRCPLLHPLCPPVLVLLRPRITAHTHAHSELYHIDSRSFLVYFCYRWKSNQL